MTNIKKPLPMVGATAGDNKNKGCCFHNQPTKPAPNLNNELAKVLLEFVVSEGTDRLGVEHYELDADNITMHDVATIATMYGFNVAEVFSCMNSITR